MKKQFCAVLSAVLLLGAAGTGAVALPECGTAAAAVCSDAETAVSCEFDETTGVLRVSGEGIVQYADTKGIHKQIKAIEMEEGITGIGSQAFANCTALTTVKLPGSLKSIQTGAFQGCTALEAITLPESLKNIDSGAFASCTALAEIVLPETMPEVGANAFEGTAWLAARRQENPLVIVGGVLLDARTAAGAVEIPAGVQVIAEGAFCGNADVTVVTVPQSVSGIKCLAFAFCTALTRLTVQNAACEIEDNVNVFYAGNPAVLLCGGQGSTLQAYAEKFGYSFLLADFENTSLSGVLNALELYNQVQLGDAPSAQELCTADADGNGVLALNDILILLQVYTDSLLA